MTAIVMASAMLFGCGSKTQPKGEVVATVDGRDITMSDLQAEARARGIRFDSPDGAAAQADVLKYVVNRTMLVDAAQKEHLDNNPAILADRRRLDDNLLAQFKVANLMKQAPAITSREIDAYRAANPRMFAGRKTMILNQVQIPSTAVLPQGGRQTMDDLTTQLQALGLPAQPVRVTVDSAGVPKAVYDALMAHPDVPVRMNTGDAVSFFTLASAQPNPASDADQKQVASRALSEQWLDRRIASDVAALKKDKKITYKPGYAPEH